MDALSARSRHAIKAGLNPREEIIALLRGQIACPVISSLGELGWLERMAERPFDHSSFPQSANRATFQSVMSYLVSLELLAPCADSQGFVATPLGRKVFLRYGAFCILNSYEEYMRRLSLLLVAEDPPRPQVNRERNTVGSGALHARKFFEPALDLHRSRSFGVVADIGCGDGKFLLSCWRRYPKAALLGVDLSEIAIQQTLRRMRTSAPEAAINALVCNGADVANWSSHLPRSDGDNGPTLISFWFLLHEISQGRAQSVIEFFKALRERCPRAEIVMGELVRFPPEVLAYNRSDSVLPELTLLHDLSRQGLLTWRAWQQVAQAIPYTVVHELLFDVIAGRDGAAQPSSFVWWLTPAE